MAKITLEAVMIYAARAQAIDEQNDITPTNKFTDQFSFCRVGHTGTAVQPDDCGKRAYTLRLGLIPLYAVAPNEPARNEPSRGAFKLYALQGRGPCISCQRTYNAA